MATYNGDRYITDQLQSLLDQSHLPAELVVGDDGSSDSTIRIVENFRTRAPFPVHIYRNEVNLGYARNFIATANRCQSEWIAFCDQDDVWLPNKLLQAATAIQNNPNCNMVLQNAWLYDGNLEVQGRKFPDKLRSGFYDKNSQYGFWVWPGFVKTVPKKMISLFFDTDLPRSWFPNDIRMTHDKATCVIANAIGGIVVLDEPVARYRRHEAALTGNYSYQTTGEKIAKSRNVSEDHYRFLSQVAKECSEYMCDLSNRSDASEWSVDFLENSRLFSKISEIQNFRAKLYSFENIFKRLSIMLKIASHGGYIGPSFVAMGLRSAAKDFSYVVTGARS